MKRTTPTLKKYLVSGATEEHRCVWCLIPATSRIGGANVGSPLSSPEHTGAMGQHTESLTLCCQWDLVGTPHSNSWSSPKHPRAFTGIQIRRHRGLSWCQAGTPDLPLAHHTSPSVHTGSPPVGPQGHIPRTPAPGKACFTPTQPPTCQNHKGYVVCIGDSITQGPSSKTGRAISFNYLLEPRTESHTK